MSVALDQFVIIVLLCMASAGGLGCFFYRMSKRQLDDNLIDPEEEYKLSKTYLKKNENEKIDCLPWEVHIDRVIINYEFPLGEGNSFVIYLGKLKGKAPIMQWINLGEMKQFQDCAVAIRVPRRFDEDEEHQLLREINAMKILKHHDYIANLLGWGYIASKGLVHRDLAARNVLLTTGLRAKICGFNFCSLVGDENFEPSKPGFRHLPIHWMAIEAMAQGKFCESSDVWSFSMLLYEMYSLGEVPMSHVKDSGLFKALKSGDRPPQPRHASDDIYDIMTRCWHRYAERRPNFTELHSQFQQILERHYDNPGFEFDDLN